VRAVLAALVLGWALVWLPVARAQPETCPPECDRIPGSAWPDPWSLPLNPTHHWPALADLAVPVVAPRFGVEELCASPPVADARAFAVAARAVVEQPGGRWRLQAQIVHWRGETWRGGELATDVFGAAVAALRSCQVSAPAVSPSLTTAEPDRIAAVISGPVIAHLYLLVDPRSSTISELVFTRTGPPAPPAPWPAVPDAQVLDAMAAPLCAAYLGSCG